MYIGIDIGGTSIKAGLVGEDGRILDRAVVKTDARHEDFQNYLAKVMADLAKELMERNGLTEADVPYIGAGFPGAVDQAAGRLLFTPNLPVDDMPAAEIFRKYLDIPLYIENDANAAAFGEFVAGAGKQYESQIMVTLGTGVGMGIVLGGRLYTGCNGVAGEGGHMTIVMDGWECGCGRKGCFEAYASASGLIRMAREAMVQEKEAREAAGPGTPSLLWETAEGSLDKVTGATIFAAASAGDETALAVVDRYTDYLAAGLINFINILQPEVIVLGGGISHAPDELLLDPLRKKMAGQDMARHVGKTTEVVKALLGNDAGIIGAAMLKAEGK